MSESSWNPNASFGSLPPERYTAEQYSEAYSALQEFCADPRDRGDLTLEDAWILGRQLDIVIQGNSAIETMQFDYSTLQGEDITGARSDYWVMRCHNYPDREQEFAAQPGWGINPTVSLSIIESSSNHQGYRRQLIIPLDLGNKLSQMFAAEHLDDKGWTAYYPFAVKGAAAMTKSQVSPQRFTRIARDFCTDLLEISHQPDETFAPLDISIPDTIPEDWK